MSVKTEVATSSAKESSSAPAAQATQGPSTPATAAAARPAPVLASSLSSPARGKGEWPLTSFASTPHNVACISFLLGALWSIGLAAASRLVVSKHLVWTLPTSTSAIKMTGQGVPQPTWSQVLTSPVLGLFVASFAVFHLLEFVVTSIWNPEKLSVSSFLLDNGIAYNAAHTLGLVEYLLEERYLPDSLRAYKRQGWLFLAGLVFLLGGQILRSFAMITASSNFSHIVAVKKLPSHQLVTNGIYAWSRHPSYAGFVWWACGTQIMLGNPISTLAFAVTLYSFFSHRIYVEERHLVNFFGQAYVDYRSKVPTRILFIR